MIGVSEALNKISSNISFLEVETVRIEQALGQVLADDVRSPIDMPPFDQSAMDGYAINGCDLLEFTLVAEIQAGDSADGIILQKGEAARIFTGAVVPNGATSVVKQELVSNGGERIQLEKMSLNGENIRPKGEQIESGGIALKKGMQLNPGAIGFLYTLGITEVTVYQKPKVIIIATGNELVSPGQPLPSGKIYESNTYTLKSTLKSMRIDAEIRYVADDYEQTKSIIGESLNDCDLLITTGGISVGDYDFVGQVLEELEVETIFYKVKQKPGKPLYFGKREGAIVFALPGNPAAVLSCFYMYVTPAIHKMMGGKNVSLEERQLTLAHPYKKTMNLTHFLKAKAYGNEVSILTAQSSAMLSSFAAANCIVRLDEGREEWIAGDTVSVFMLP